MTSWRGTIARLHAALPLRSIKSKIVIFALLATLVPTTITAWIAYGNSKRALTDKIAEELQGTSSRAARELDLWFAQRIQDIRVFAGSYEVADNLRSIGHAIGDSSGGVAARVRVGDYLRAIAAQFPDYQELRVVDVDALPVATSGERGRFSPLPADWLARVRSEPAVVGTPTWDEPTDMAILPIGVPVRAADGRFLGVLVASLNFRTVNDLLQSFTAGRTGQLSLVSETGAVITSSHESSAALMETRLPGAAMRALLEREGRLHTYVDAGGIEMVGSLRPLPRAAWAVVATVPRSEAYAEVARLRNTTIAIVAALLLGVGLIAYQLGLFIVQPLDRLTRGAGWVAAGDLAVDLPVEGGGEVGYLTSVFNNMVARLREGRATLDAINDELRAKNEELELLSITDGLTGLYNRRYLMDTLDREARRTRRSKHAFTLLLVDVDHFKQVNDTHGHRAGDDVLIRLASVLTHATREVDIVARYGGEEFILLFPETETAGAMVAAERIRQRLAEEALPAGEELVSITASIGVAEYPADGDTPESLLSSVDAALYEAKRGGRNRVVRAKRARARNAEPRAEPAT